MRAYSIWAFYKAIQSDGFVKVKSRSRLVFALWQKWRKKTYIMAYQRLFSECIFCQTRFYSISCIPKMMKLDECVYVSRWVFVFRYRNISSKVAHDFFYCRCCCYCFWSSFFRIYLVCSSFRNVQRATKLKTSRRNVITWKHK